MRVPHWWEPRLVIGVLLVCASVGVGNRVFAAADDTRAVWALTRDLAAGSTLAAADLRVRQVRLDGSANPYVGAGGTSPTGSTLRRDLGAGELLPASALGAPGREPERLVTVPVGRDRLPLGLETGQRVDVYVAVPAERGGGDSPRQILAVSGARVAEVEETPRYSGGGQGRVVLAVPVARVAGLVAALAAGSVDLVRLP